MRSYLLLLLMLPLSLAVVAQSQYYLRGEVKDEAGNPLQNVQIRQHSTGLLFRTGNWGTFGITTRADIDTLYFYLEGYRSEKVTTNKEEFIRVALKLLPPSVTKPERARLSSSTLNMTKEDRSLLFAGQETYAALSENQWVKAARFPTTGLSLNVDRASYSNIRRFLLRDSYIPADAVRIEEIINYFPAPYTHPADSMPIHFLSLLGPCPWNWNHHLLQVNLSARKLNLDSLPPSHLVFLVDISASMDIPSRLPLLQAGFRGLVNNLREKDSVSIVVYGGLTAILTKAVSGKEKDSLYKVIDAMVPGGSTPGESGIKLAYKVAKQHFIEGGNNRVILATDGDFNVGLKSEEELDELISAQRQSGIYLTCLGVGMGNYKDSKIQLLAQKGNGNFSYLDSEREAEKVLMREFAQTMYAVADDVYLTMDFDPAYVNAYRLIGFDNKAGAIMDTASVIEGGELGSGHSLTALFEIEPSPLLQQQLANRHQQDSFATAQLQFRYPLDSVHQIMKTRFPVEYAYSEKDLKRTQLVACLAQFGMLLKDSPFMKQSGWNELLTLGEQVIDPSDPWQAEWLELVKKARVLYDKKRKKKWFRLYR
ncbi:MAG: YfbK domain-containing protein [Chitinophagaceae bacterium]